MHRFLEMAPGCSRILMISRAPRHNSLASHPHFFLLAGCLLLTLSIHVGATRVGAAISMGELGLEHTSSSSGRGLLDQQRPPPNGTQNLGDDGAALLHIKEAITADPKNITFWWKPQGRKRALNPCKVRNGVKEFWPGIDCSADRRVTAINLSNMSLNGTLSPILGTLTRLKYLNLSGNFFAGPIPVELGMATALETVDLGNNKLEGELPPSLGNLNNLTLLAVGNNRLGGSIPATLGALELLTTLNISGNNLTGVIPVELNSCRILTAVDLSRNGLLQGAVPFQNLENLTVLHLQENQFDGSFVANLGTFPQLLDVDLSNNNFDGVIPTSIGFIPLTIQLSLGHNSLTGSIPSELGDLSLVRKIDLSGNQLNGNLPPTVNTLLSLREFDVSDNLFTGALPRNLMFLPSLQTFNASHNGFNGSLPTLDKMSTLQTFDASFNNLTGGVGSTLNFSTLLYLNVSYNQLSGEVPLFDRHDGVNGNSFLHNLALCGVMVGVLCSVAGSSDSMSQVVAISVGCSVAFVAVLVLLLLIRRRRNKERKGRSSATVSASLEMQLSPDDILRITENFRHTIGVGSKSTVYRGVLADGTVVAVKRFGIRRGEIDEGGEKVLADEFERLGTVRHWTAVKVLGFCCSPDMKAVVMEYLPNGTLSALLHPPLDTSVIHDFNWSDRFNVAIVVAESLKYLHHESLPSTVHGDLKPSNVLFNTFREARVADFGVTRILASRGIETVQNSGYTAPDAGTLKGDVYSFGILMLEILTGRSPQSLEQGQRLPQWIRATITSSKSLQVVLDPILMSELRQQQQRMAMVLGVALLCTREDPVERPYITDVLKMLNHIKTRPQDGGSRRFRTSLSTHQRNEEIRQEVPGIEIERSPPDTPPAALPANPSLSHWTPNDPHNR